MNTSSRDKAVWFVKVWWSELQRASTSHVDERCLQRLYDLQERRETSWDQFWRCSESTDELEEDLRLTRREGSRRSHIQVKTRCKHDSATPDMKSAANNITLSKYTRIHWNINKLRMIVIFLSFTSLPALNPRSSFLLGLSTFWAALAPEETLLL